MAFSCDKIKFFVCLGLFNLFFCTACTDTSVDLSGSSLASSYAWSEGSSTTNLVIHASWIPLTSNLQNQSIQFYTGACAAPSGALINLGSSTINSYSFTGTNGNTYSYRITSVDTLGNSEVSPCSATITETPVLTDDSNSSTLPSFNQGTRLGTAWGLASDGTTSVLKISTATNNSELNPSWTPQWSNLLAYWNLNEPSGSTFSDRSGHGMTATGYNSPSTAVPGKLNTAIDLNGGNQYLTAPINLDNYPTLTFSVWVNVTTVPPSITEVVGNDDGNWDRSILTDFGQWGSGLGK